MWGLTVVMSFCFYAFRWDAKAGAGDALVEPGRSMCWGPDPGNWRTCLNHRWWGASPTLPRWPPEPVSVCLCVFVCATSPYVIKWQYCVCVTYTALTVCSLISDFSLQRHTNISWIQTDHKLCLCSVSVTGVLLVFLQVCSNRDQLIQAHHPVQRNLGPSS